MQGICKMINRFQAIGTLQTWWELYNIAKIRICRLDLHLHQRIVQLMPELKPIYHTQSCGYTS